MAFGVAFVRNPVSRCLSLPLGFTVRATHETSILTDPKSDFTPGRVTLFQSDRVSTLQSQTSSQLLAHVEPRSDPPQARNGASHRVHADNLHNFDRDFSKSTGVGASSRLVLTWPLASTKSYSFPSTVSEKDEKSGSMRFTGSGAAVDGTRPAARHAMGTLAHKLWTPAEIT